MLQHYLQSPKQYDKSALQYMEPLYNGHQLGPLRCPYMHGGELKSEFINVVSPHIMASYIAKERTLREFVKAIKEKECTNNLQTSHTKQ